MQNIYQIKINNKNYDDWYYTDLLQNKININYNPIEYKLFNDDIIIETYSDTVLDVSSNTETNQSKYINTIKIIDSAIRKNKNIPGVLILKDNKTYGRVEKDNNMKNGKLLYKCIPYDKCLPPFLIPYELKNTSFSKLYSNLYVTFSFSNWDKNDKHPIGVLSNIIGDVNSTNTSIYYEYQLLCKNLNISIQNFNKELLNNIKIRFDSTTLELNKIDSQFILMQYPELENRTEQEEWNIFTIDSVNSTDYDDAFSIKQINTADECEKYMISIYISNVSLWMELFNLWSAFSNRVSNIYLPDKKISMLPTLMCSNLCSLIENEYRYAFTMDIIVSVQSYECSNETDAVIENIEFKNTVINVSNNYSYSQPALLENATYKKLFYITKILSEKYVCYYDVNNSQNMVAYLMILMNYYCAKNLKKNNTGILLKNNIINIPKITDSSVQLNKLDKHDDLKNYVKTWHLSKSEYISFKELNINNTTISTIHESLEIDSYTHITSPIRRIVDLLNLIEMQQINGLFKFSKQAIQFYKKWSSNECILFINNNMKSIRKLQNECNLLDMFYNIPEFIEKHYDGYIIDIQIKNNINKIIYNVYIPELKITSKISKLLQINDIEPTINNMLYSRIRCKLYVFTDQYNITQKIRLEEVCV
jgi:exoribonuclease R